MLMIELMKKIQCCGCTACSNICPQNAISMLPDEEGFNYPKVDKSNCVNCGLCEQVCPVINPPTVGVYERTSYELRIKDKDVLSNSTSGGFITPLIEYVLQEGGVACAASYDEDYSVSHIVLENHNGGGTALNTIRGSKHVQSSLGDSFTKLKRYLDHGKTVCFVGTTCQVNGLKSFLRKSYENLITVDLVCHGTPSPKLWSKYLSYQKDKYRSEITEISFRNKTYGYHSGTMKIRFKNGKTYYGSARVDYMLKSFFSEIASRPICYQCPFKTLERCSDFTIYDCWHASELVSFLIDDDKGYTNIIVQSEIGKQVLEKIKGRYEIYPVDTDQAIHMDGVMLLNSAKPHPKRNQFYSDLDKRPLPEHIQQFIPITIKDRAIEKSKILLYQTGLYGAVRKLRK